MKSLESTMKSSVTKLMLPTVVPLATILACGLAHSSFGDGPSNVPNCIELAGDVMGFFHRVATNFTELSERMDPTCSECNQP
jgi:hypothetical protein